MTNKEHKHNWGIWRLALEDLTDSFIILYVCDDPCEAVRFSTVKAEDI